MGSERRKSTERDAAGLAGAANPGWASRIKKVVGADRPPGVRRPGVGGENQEFVFAFDTNPGDPDRQVAWAIRLAREFLGGEPKRVGLCKVRFPDAVSPEHCVRDDRADLRPFAHRNLRRSSGKRAAGVWTETTQVDVELVLASDNC